MKRLLCTLLAALCLHSANAFAADYQISVYREEQKKTMEAVMLDGTTMVSARDFAECFSMELIWLSNMKTVIFWDDLHDIRIQTEQTEFYINDIQKNLETPARILSDRAYVPLRALAETVGARVLWNADKQETEVHIGGTLEMPEAISAFGSFYHQRQPEWAFENNGGGYCWVCCYAMAITNLGKTTVTPAMVAELNLQKGTSGAYMQHGSIAEEFGVRFVRAIPEESEYFAKYEAWKGATYLHAETDEAAAAAIRMALDAHPQGVMVRYTVYPHTLLAVGYEGDTIYFNDPAYETGERIPFSETCLKKYSLKDLDFLQVVELQNP